MPSKTIINLFSFLASFSLFYLYSPLTFPLLFFNLLSSFSSLISFTFSSFLSSPFPSLSYSSPSHQLSPWMPVSWETLTLSSQASTWGRSFVTLHWGWPRAWRKPSQRQLATSSPHPHLEIYLMNSGDTTSHRHCAPCSRWVRTANLIPKPHAVCASCVACSTAGHVWVSLMNSWCTPLQVLLHCHRSEKALADSPQETLGWANCCCEYQWALLGGSFQVSWTTVGWTMELELNVELARLLCSCSAMMAVTCSTPV